MSVVTYCLLVLNSLSFVLYGWDKWQAKKGGERISEKVLLFSTLTMGAVGAALAMKIFSHKTQKPLFKLLVPILMAFQILALAFYYGARLPK
ncbi:MAG: DUF1294 domain-containing protein [Tissierellia bacterium]|nr:DUF1294 domain-containing protein [Tissierellia bacterium]